MRQTWIISLIIPAMVSAVFAADITVQKRPGEKIFIDVSSYKGNGDPEGMIFATTLKRDLEQSGWFKQVARRQAELTLSGMAQAVGGTINAKCRVFNLATQQSIHRKTYRAASSSARSLAHQAADEIVKAVSGREGFASSRLVMVGTRSGSKELYLCDSDGGNLYQLTQDKTVSVAPRWGPHNQKIIYTSFIKRFPDVLTIDVKTGRRKIEAQFPGMNMGGAISPDGRAMAMVLSKDGNPELYLKNMENGSLTRITRTTHAAEASPCWSPDGAQIAFVSDRAGRPQVYVIGRGGGRPTRITSHGSENVAPDWGKNGWIACSSLISGRYQIILVKPSTKEIKQLTSDVADYEDPTWARDGRHLACSRTVNYVSHIYLLDTMGDPEVRLTNYSGDWFSPSWSH